jgi:hypothetical protein
MHSRFFKTFQVLTRLQCTWKDPLLELKVAKTLQLWLYQGAMMPMKVVETCWWLSLIQQRMLVINLNSTTYIYNQFKSNNTSNRDLEFGILYNMIVVGKTPYKMCMEWWSKSITLVPFGDFPFFCISIQSIS